MSWDRDLSTGADPRPEVGPEIGPEAGLADVLAESLAPRGPDFLYAVVRSLDLPPDSDVVDVGCGQGRDAARLALHFGFEVLGIDPVPRHLEQARHERDGLERPVASRLSFARGTAADIPRPNASVDLVWCRDALVHEHDLEGAFREIVRVLRPGGWVMISQVVATARLTAAEAEEIFPVLGVDLRGADRAVIEEEIAAVGLRVEESYDLSSEWGEHAEESEPGGASTLLRLARLLRDPDRYRERFGAAAYDVLVAEHRWHAYRMLGKLSRQVWLLRRP